MTALVIAEHDTASLKASTLNTVAAASQCASDVHVLVAGHTRDAAAATVAQFAGVLTEFTRQLKNDLSTCELFQGLKKALIK